MGIKKLSALLIFANENVGRRCRDWQSKVNILSCAVLHGCAVMSSMFSVAGLFGCLAASGCNRTLSSGNILVVPACPASVGPVTCYSNAPLAPPVIISENTIRVVMSNAFGRERQRFAEQFFLVDITQEGERVIAEGRCATGNQVVRLGLLSKGQTAVLCAPTREWQGFQLGILDPITRNLEWSWYQPLDAGGATGVSHDTPHFADVGNKVVFLFKVNRETGFGPRTSWQAQLVPGPRQSFPIEGDFTNSQETAVPLFVANGTAHVIAQVHTEGPDQYVDVTISEAGNASMQALLPTSRVLHQKLRRPCVAQGTDGSVAISLPFQSADETNAGDGTLRYVRAKVHLSHGPDVYPLQAGFCPPEVARYYQPVPEVGRLDCRPQWLRATGAKPSLVVFRVPDSDWGLAGPAHGYRYSQSFRILRQLRD